MQRTFRGGKNPTAESSDLQLTSGANLSNLPCQGHTFQ